MYIGQPIPSQPNIARHGQARSHRIFGFRKGESKSSRGGEASERPDGHTTTITATTATTTTTNNNNDNNNSNTHIASH